MTNEITMHAGETFLIYDESGLTREVTTEQLRRMSAGDEVDTRVKNYQATHPEASYEEGLDVVLKNSPRLKLTYVLGR